MRLRHLQLEQKELCLWRERNRTAAEKLRWQTVEAARSGMSLLPARIEQRRLVMDGLAEIYGRLKQSPSCRPSQAMVGILSGSYARTSCTIGSDLELSVTFPEENRPALFPIEREIVSTVAWLYDFSAADICNDATLISGKKTCFSLEDFDFPYDFPRVFLQLYSNQIVQRLYRSGKREGDFQQLYRRLTELAFALARPFEARYALRDLAQIRRLCEERLDPTSPWFDISSIDYPLNLVFAFGNRAQWEELELARIGIFREFRAQTNAVRQILRTLEIKIGRSQGWVTAENHLAKAASVKQFATTVKQGALYYYFFLKELAELAEVPFRNVDWAGLEASAETLLKIKALFYVQGDSFPRLGAPHHSKISLSSSLAWQVANTIGCTSERELSEMISAEMVNILKSVGKARLG